MVPELRPGRLRRRPSWDETTRPSLRVGRVRGGKSAGVPVHVVAERCGHDPAVLLRIYAKRTKKADTGAAAVIGALSKGALRG